jgi:hypothetical protein
MLAAVMPVFSSTAKAITENPANWTFTLETYGDPNSWTSATAVDTGFPQYDYDWQLTEAKLYVDVIGELPILEWIPAEDKSGSGTESGLPFNIFGPVNPLRIEFEGIISADIYLGVDSEGYGQAHIPQTTLVFGDIEGFAVMGTLFGGDLNVTAVPEPATVLLLALGGLALLRKRR